MNAETARPRVLVVRSGANPFASVGPSALVEIVEKVSHAIQPLNPGEEPFIEAPQLTIFTSQVAVERFASDPDIVSARKKAAALGQVAAVGRMTASALRRHGIDAQIVATGSTESMLEILPKDLTGRRVLYVCGEDAATELPDGLHRRGARIARAVVYRKVPRIREASLEREIASHAFAAFLTTSPSAASWLFTGLAPAAADRLRATPAVVLGRFTRRMLESQGVVRIEMADEPSFSSALRLLERLAGAPIEA